jgi:6-phosphogluconolactonase (cycloisomerase 2 family)
VFARDEVSGRLSRVELEPDVGGEVAFGSDDRVVVSPDGRHVYTNAAGVLAVLARDQDSGAVSFVAAVDPAGVFDISPDGGHLYGVRSGELNAFSRGEEDGKLVLIQTVLEDVSADGLDGASSIDLSPDGRHIYVSAFSPGDSLGMDFHDVTVFGRDIASGLLTFVETQRAPTNLERFDRAGGVAVSADGSHVFVAGYGRDALGVFVRDPMTGKLTLLETQFDGVRGVDGLDGPSSVAVSPDNRHVYVTGDFDQAVAVFAVRR